MKRVKLRLTYTKKGTPYKWKCECPCGWRCLSWDWERSIGHANEHAFYCGTGIQPPGWVDFWTGAPA